MLPELQQPHRARTRSIDRPANLMRLSFRRRGLPIIGSRELSLGELVFHKRCRIMCMPGLNSNRSPKRTHFQCQSLKAQFRQVCKVSMFCTVLHTQHGAGGAPLQVDPPKTILDRLVMVILIAGAIVFAYFQVVECIRAHESPSSQTFVANVDRMYPGLMICPFSIDNMRETGICPKWSPQAVLSFEFGEGIYLENNNFDSLSNRQSASKCCNNIRSLIPASLDASLYIQPSNRNRNYLVTVKNQGSRVSPLCPDYLGLKNVCAQQNIPEFCDGWTPPNVQCLVIDPLRLDYVADCNPVKEVRANSVDSLRLNANSYGVYNEPGKGRRVDSFTYNG